MAFCAGVKVGCVMFVVLEAGFMIWFVELSSQYKNQRLLCSLSFPALLPEERRAFYSNLEKRKYHFLKTL
jgi:hypothetical protein